ncbi:c-type cytochrome biogenesis protein CcmI [Caenispirillum salinarum]|uniref:c-type cytochrome biogenesis protein CcmI n=1 Tax=Caenispirillum salinarum TaxID=859058 RepID=UPI00385136B7
MIAFWIALALITGAVILLLVMPLLRRTQGPVDQATYDLAVYKDQLKEVDRDRERGLLSDEEAAAARLEIERRILAAAPVEKAPVTAKNKKAKDRKAAQAAGPQPLTGWARMAGIASVIIVPAGALAMYISLGTPGMPDQPYAERSAQRMDMDQQAADEMVQLTEQLAERLEAEPDNPQGWAMLGRSYAALGRYDAALSAYRQAVERGQTDPDTWAALGEAHVASQQGTVTPQAAVAFRNALSRSRQDPRSRYYMGLFQLQQGEPRTAIAIWRDLEAESPADAPWMPMIQDAIRQTAMQNSIPPVGVGTVHPLDLPGQGTEAVALPEGQGDGDTAPGPRAEAPDAGADDADPGAEMRAQADAERGERGGGFTGEEQEMIQGMVSGLAERLEENPEDVDGWLRLGRAYLVLQQPQDAVDAYQAAVKQDPDNLDALRGLANAQASTAQVEGLTRPDAAFYDTLRAILAVEPADVAALKLLGENAATTGETDQARDYWTRLRDALPEDSPDRAEVERRLDQLGS